MGIPQSNAALPSYVTNFSAKLSAAPGDYGTTSTVATQFADIASAYTAAQTELVAAREAGMRSEVLRESRDDAREALMPTLQSLYGMIQKNRNVADPAKVEIGVHIPKTTKTKHGPVMVRPSLGITSVVDRLVSISVEDPTVGSKASRPKLATETLIYFFAGENYPTDPTTWSFAGRASERKFSFTIPGSVPAGTRIWVCAAYASSRGQSGLVSVPISTSVQGSGELAAETGLKLAA